MNKILSGLMLLVLLTPFNTKAETVINNSVSVSTNGNISTTKIQTTHNGETIEDVNVSTTTPYHYESNYQSEDDEVKIFTQTSSQSSEYGRITQLNILLNQLQKLLIYYEKLLAEQNS